ncbi:MAG: lipoate--protein ligase [Halothermotrichaceae bacterium]
MANKTNNIKKLEIINSTGIDPWYNLALEEYLLKQIEPGEVILYLWQNQNTVVIGRNQNAWKECRCELLESEGGKLARRLSGGGAVFHDLGNLNFTFLVDKNLYDLETQLEVILKAVRDQGIPAEFSGRNDLVLKGKKFSGNAFYFAGDAAYHHGTILLDTDFEKLTRYLQVSKEKIKSKGIESVRSRVVNLKEVKPELSLMKMEKALENSFLKIYRENKRDILVEKQEIDPENNDKIKKIYKKYLSWEWRYGETPDFDIVFEQRFDWGNIELGLKLTKGQIEQANVYSDAMYSHLIQDIAESFKGVPFKLDNILTNIDKLKVTPEQNVVIQDLKKWLKTKLH